MSDPVKQDSNAQYKQRKTMGTFVLFYQFVQAVQSDKLLQGSRKRHRVHNHLKRTGHNRDSLAEEDRRSGKRLHEKGSGRQLQAGKTQECDEG